MNVTPLLIPDLMLIEPTVFCDSRGFFYESFNQRQFEQAIGLSVNFVQDNHSRSVKNVIRGLHYQIKHPQGKLIRVISGSIFDVVVDIRKSSSTFGQWVSKTLTAEHKTQLWIPPGFAHGFAVLSDSVEILYKTTDYWMPEYECCIAWDDPSLAIAWPVLGSPELSNKDQQGIAFNSAVVFE